MSAVCGASSCDEDCNYDFWLRLVRHGETDANVRRVCEAGSDTPLNDTGLQQGAALGRSWRREGARFSRVYSSDIARALETCRVALTESPAAADPSTVIHEPLLREREMGSLHGVDYDEAIRRRREAKEHNATIDGLETSEHMIERAACFFRRVCDDMRRVDDKIGAEAVAFSHGGMIYTILVYLQTVYGLQLGHLQPLEALHASPNAAQTRLRVKCINGVISVTCQVLYSDEHVPSELRSDHFLSADGAKIPRPK